MKLDLTLYDVIFDKVIGSYYLTLSVTYDYAISNFVPLINKLDFQRNPLRKSFYKRLENDILNGCIMPNITLAIHLNDELPEKELISIKYIEENIKNAFVLDGIQRLTTMQRIYEDDKFPHERKLYCNIIISNSMDRLLYRMITLNNGQKPMTARHQIEILASNLFDFSKLSLLTISEKEAKIKKANIEYVNKDVLIKGYLAYISRSINIDNQKIIESKMNELIADKIMDSNIPDKKNEFKDVIDFIQKLLKNKNLNEWFKIANNFIGFCAAMNKGFDEIKNINDKKFLDAINLFESAFSAIDVSKIKLGMARRRLVQNYFESYKKYSEYSETDLIDHISQEI